MNKIQKNITTPVNESDFIIDGGFFDLASGTCGFEDAYIKKNIKGLRITAALFKEDGESVSRKALLLFLADYSSGTHLGKRSIHLGVSSVPSHGYSFVMQIEENAGCFLEL